MASLRNAILVAVLAATAIAAIAGYFLGGPPSRLLVDAGLAIALAIIIVVMLNPTMQRTSLLVEALRALARGDRHQRVNADDFAGLAEVARAMNEVAASLTESEDPNLGPVKSQPHPTFKKKIERPARKEPSVDFDDPEVSNHPELGQVRVMKKREGPSETTLGEAISEAIAAKNAKNGNGSRPPSPAAPPIMAAQEARPQKAAPHNDTAIDDAPRSDISGEPQIPTKNDLESLFQEFVAAKKSHDENVADLDFDAFAQTIQGECERLISAHQCKGVRFEVTMQDGEVSLRPRLLR